MRWPWKRGTGKRRTPRQETGRAGERAAERYLKKHGHRVLARNLQFREREVDLVTREKASGTVCFVEVRSCTAADGEEPFVAPEQTVTRAKRSRVISVANAFLAQRGWRDVPVRFDVVGVYFQGADRKHPRIRHFPGAFDATGR